MRSGPEQPTATERSDEPWAYCISTGQLRENKGESVSRAEWRGAKRAVMQRRRTVSTDHHVSKGTVAICIVSSCLSPPASHASCTIGALALAPRPAPVVLYSFWEAHAARSLGPVERKVRKFLWFLCAISSFNHFFDEPCSGKFIFMLRA